MRPSKQYVEQAYALHQEIAALEARLNEMKQELRQHPGSYEGETCRCVVSPMEDTHSMSDKDIAATLAEFPHLASLFVNTPKLAPGALTHIKTECTTKERRVLLSRITVRKNTTRVAFKSKEKSFRPTPPETRALAMAATPTVKPDRTSEPRRTLRRPSPDMDELRQHLETKAAEWGWPREERGRVYETLYGEPCPLGDLTEG